MAYVPTYNVTADGDTVTIYHPEGGKRNMSRAIVADADMLARLLREAVSYGVEQGKLIQAREAADSLVNEIKNGGGK